MKAKILPPTARSINQLAEALRRDELVGMPTETVYGLAGNARSPVALAQIFETKERPTFDPLIIHVQIPHINRPTDPLSDNSLDEIESLKALDLVELNALSAEKIQELQILIRNFWPGPLTLVLPKTPSVPDLATSGLPSVAIRMPQHPVALALIEAAQTPLAAPSANRFGRISPTTAEAVKQELGDRISWILDGGPSKIGVESTILGLTPGQEWVVLRPGGTPLEKIEAALGTQIQKMAPSSPLEPKAEPELSTETRPMAPGMLESHYAPRTPLILLPREVHALTPQDLESIRATLDKLPRSPAPSNAAVGLLLVGGDSQAGSNSFSAQVKRPVRCRTLSAQGDLNEAAQRLFSEMRYLDSLELPVIFTEPCLKQEGLGFAISDRLRRASALRHR
jgi:L-threonylcarbamoyladenylate synthase